MSFWSTAANVGVQLAGQFLGGSSGGSDVNLARKFSKQCGISPPVEQQVAKFAKQTANPCATARSMVFGGEGIFRQATTPPPPAPDPRLAVLKTPALPPLPPTGGTGMSLVPGGPSLGGLPIGMAGIAGLIPAVGRVVAGILRSKTGKITAVITAAGKRVSRKNAVKLAKDVGIGVAAATLGISAVELAEMVLDEASKPRRRRGITARDLSNARRVNCAIARYSRDLGIKPAVRRRTSCR